MFCGRKKMFDEIDSIYKYSLCQINQQQCSTSQSQRCRENPQQRCVTQYQTVCGGAGVRYIGDNIPAVGSRYYVKRESVPEMTRNSTDTTGKSATRQDPVKRQVVPTMKRNITNTGTRIRTVIRNRNNGRKLTGIRQVVGNKQCSSVPRKVCSTDLKR